MKNKYSLYCFGVVCFLSRSLDHKMADFNLDDDSSNDSNDNRDFEHLNASSCRWRSQLLDDLWTGEIVDLQRQPHYTDSPDVGISPAGIVNPSHHSLSSDV